MTDHGDSEELERDDGQSEGHGVSAGRHQRLHATQRRISAEGSQRREPPEHWGGRDERALKQEPQNHRGGDQLPMPPDSRESSIRGSGHEHHRCSDSEQSVHEGKGTPLQGALEVATLEELTRQNEELRREIASLRNRDGQKPSGTTVPKTQ